jgi:hypothetical protein
VWTCRGKANSLHYYASTQAYAYSFPSIMVRGRWIRCLWLGGVKAVFQSSHEAPRSSLRVHALSSNHNANDASTRSELRGASCEDWKTAFRMGVRLSMCL